MSIVHFAEQYAPDLINLALKLEAFDGVIIGSSAGPQKPDAPEQRQHLDILIDTEPGKPGQWITVYSPDHCEWWHQGEEYRLTLDKLIAYLDQLPKPLHCFSTYMENEE